MNATVVVQPDLWDPAVLDAVHGDWRHSRRDARAALRAAVHACAAEHDGLVHVSWFRDRLPAWIAPPTIGAAIAGWTAAGHLQRTGDWLPLGGHAGNEGKPAAVRRLVRPIPAETAGGPR